MKRFGINLDTLGMCASTVCMLHCLAFPALLVAMPLWSAVAGQPAEVHAAPAVEASDGATAEIHCTASCCAKPEAPVAEATVGSMTDACCDTPSGQWFHMAAFGTVAPLGMTAWGAGFMRHRRVGVLALGTLGVALLGGALLFGHPFLGGNGEWYMNVTGSVCIVSAHLWNRRSCDCCEDRGCSATDDIDGVPIQSRLTHA